jgi:ABC-2 type transport system ATP-binding protein
MPMDAIVIESVSKIFRQRSLFGNWRGKQSQDTAALSGVSLCVPPGTVQVLLGPNGSGKTTLLKLMATMLLPDSGKVVINACDSRADSEAIRKMVGYAVANERSFYPRLTARENLEFFAALDEVPRRERTCRINELLTMTALIEHADKQVMKFSSGMYQRLGIARALLKQPVISLLDEPSRSLDPASAAHLWCVIRELSSKGTTVVVATHSFQEAVTVGDRVAILCRGVIAGTTRVNTDCSPESLRAFYFDHVDDNDEQRNSFTDAHDDACLLAG